MTLVEAESRPRLEPTRHERRSASVLAACAFAGGVLTAPAFRIGSPSSGATSTALVVVLAAVALGVWVIADGRVASLTAALAASTYVAVSVDVAGQKVQMVDLVTLLAVGAAAVLVLGGRRPSRLSVHVAASAVAFAAIGFAAGLGALPVGDLAGQAVKYLAFAGACLFAGIARPSGTEWTMRTAFTVIVAGTAGVLIRVVYEEAAGDALGRVSLKCTSVALVFGLALYLRSRRASRWTVAPVALLLVGAYVVEASRQSVLFLVLFGIVVLIGSRHLRSRKVTGRVIRLTLATGLGLALAMAAGMGTAQLERVLPGGGGSALQSNALRSAQADLAVALFRADPIFGGGLGRFAAEAEARHLIDPGGTQIDSPHSEWLNAGVQAGVLGVVLTVVAVLAPPLNIWRSLVRWRLASLSWLLGAGLTLYVLVIATFGDLSGSDRAIVVICVGLARTIDRGSGPGSAQQEADR